MVLKVNSELINFIKKIDENIIEKSFFGALVGSINVETNDIEILSVIHLDKKTNAINLTEDDNNHLNSLNYMLPYPLKIVGILYYSTEEITTYSLQNLAKKSNIRTLLTIVTQFKKKTNFYTVSEDKPAKLAVEIEKLPKIKLASVIHTMEFETLDEIKNNSKKLKEELFNGLEKHWNTLKYNKNSEMKFKKIMEEKRSLDRIIEAIIPCEEKDLSSKTPEGKLFLAFDLHMNIYPTKEIQTKKLADLKDFFFEALKQDLLIKLQRSFYDENSNTLISPRKIPIKYLDLDLNAYYSKEKPSKFEFELLKRMIKNAKLLFQTNQQIKSRILLRDLREYFAYFKDEKIIEIIDKQISELI